MLRRWLPIWIAALIFGSAIGVPLYLVGSQFHPSISGDPREDEDGGANRSTEEKTDDRVAKYTLWLAILTGVLTTATIGLMTVTVFQLRLGRQDFISTHRPRLRVRKVTLRRPLTEGFPLEVQYEIANVGGSEATILLAAVSIEITKKPQHPQQLGSGRYVPEDNRTIAAGGHLLPCFKTTLIYQNETQSAREYMIIRGVVHYEDGNGIKRHTAFERVNDAGSYRFFKGDNPSEDYEYED